MSDDKIEKFMCGTIKLLSMDGAVLYGGQGVFVEDRKLLYASIQSPGKPKELEEFRILFIPNKKQNKVFLSIGSYVGFCHFDFDDEERALRMKEYIVADSEDDALMIAKNGIIGMSIHLSGESEKTRSSLITTDERLSVERFESGTVEKIGERDFSDGTRISLSCSFQNNFPNGALKNILGVSVRVQKEFSINEYYRLSESLDLYWDFYKKDTIYETSRVYFFFNKNDGSESLVSAIIERRSVSGNVSLKPLIVEKPDIDLSVLHRIMVYYNDGLKNKIVYGFSGYLRIKCGEISDIQYAVLKLASALDSVSAEASKEKISSEDKKQIKKNIEKVLSLIKAHKQDFSGEVVDFYLGGAEGVYRAIRNKNTKLAVKDAFKKYNIEYSSEEEKAVEEVLRARHQIIHGQSYDIPKMLLSLTGRNTITEQLEGKSTVYTFGYEQGYIFQVLNLLRRFGMKFFEQDELSE